jgi:tRNA dimethylallyltransferase
LRARLRARARARGVEWLHRMLRRLDRDAAERIHAHDVPKVVRALEVCLTARRPLTELWRQGSEPLRGFRILRLGLNPDRDALYTRLNRRAASMFEQGLVEEAAALWEKYGEAAGPLRATGYRQALQFLRGETPRKTALWAAAQAHRNYAKRQMTWFRREPDVHWVRGFGDDPQVQRTAEELVTGNL